MGHESTFLFATPSFWEGVGRLVDFDDALSEHNLSESPERADAWATWNDWLAVGNDLRRSFVMWHRLHEDPSEQLELELSMEPGEDEGWQLPLRGGVRRTA